MFLFINYSASVCEEKTKKIFAHFSCIREIHLEKSIPKVYQPERLLLVYFFLNPIFTKSRKPLPHKGLRRFEKRKIGLKNPIFWSE